MLILIKKVSMLSVKLEKGQLLVADPDLIGDVSFNKAVILLTDHNSQGSVGFIINKPLKFTIEDLVPDVSGNFKIYNGGPVEQDNLYFLHNVPDLIPDSIEISNGIYWGGCFDTVKELINNQEINKDNIRFFLGYSCWDESQLETELEQKSWIVTSNNYKNKIIGKTTSQIWKEKIIEIGGDYLIWSNAPENPYLN
jgi:putative transcriptional regulator